MFENVTALCSVTLHAKQNLPSFGLFTHSCFLTYSVRLGPVHKSSGSDTKPGTPQNSGALEDLVRWAVLTGMAHLSNGTKDVLRWSQQGQKPHIKQKGKGPLDFDFQYGNRP